MMELRFQVRRRALVLFWIAIATCLSASGQEVQGLGTANPEEVGLSSSRLERLGAAVQRSIDEKRIAGAVTLVARKGRIAWLKAQGMMDLEAGKPMRTDAIFRICSMTKPITSVALMMLYEEGRFLLDDPVSKFIPEFKNPKVLVKPTEGEPTTTPAGREITIRNLLTHTSGLTYHWRGDLGARYHDAGVSHGLLHFDGTAADNIKKLAGLPLLFAPGERFEYSMSVDVLGYLVEVLSGLNLDEFLKKRIFNPLGMKDTRFFMSETEASARLATAYTWYEEKGLSRFPDQPIVEGPMVYSADVPYRGPKRLYSGGGGLCSTAADYARFGEMLLRGGKLGTARLLNPKTVEVMTQDQLGNKAPNTAFGLGFGIAGTKGPLRELSTPGTYGWGGFFYTTFFVDPKEEMVGIFMAQLHPSGGLSLNRTFEILAQQAIVQ
jgi:CubicO group peptidase (beta-lactamase class C family)